MTELLRPMSTGELMDRTFVLYRKNFRLFVGIASLGPVSYLLFQLLTIGSASLGQGTSRGMRPLSMASAGLGVVAAFLLLLVGWAISQAATVKAVASVHLGQSTTILEAYRSLRGRILRVIGVFVCMSLLAGLAAMGAVVLLTIAIMIVKYMSLIGPILGRAGQIFAIVFGFITVIVVSIAAMMVWVRYALAIACCVVEDLKVRKSIRRSAALSKGSRFRVFLILVVFTLLAVVLGAVLGGLAGGLGVLIPNLTVRLVLLYLAGFIVGLLTGPLASIALALVYYDERVRKEAFDLQLMMSNLAQEAPLSQAAVTAQP